jgi:hypothetical protein
MYAQPFGMTATTSLTSDNCLHGSEELLRSDDHLIAPDPVIAEITTAAWKFVIFDRIMAESAISAVRDVVKAFDELVPTSVLRDRALGHRFGPRLAAYSTCSALQ